MLEYLNNIAGWTSMEMVIESLMSSASEKTLGIYTESWHGSTMMEVSTDASMHVSVSLKILPILQPIPSSNRSSNAEQLPLGTARTTPSLESTLLNFSRNTPLYHLPMADSTD